MQEISPRQYAIYIGEEFTEHLEQLEEMEDCFQLINEIFEIIQQREVYDNSRSSKSLQKTYFT